MNGAFFTAAGSAAGMIGVFIVLVRHMLSSARQQGARDERERQMSGRIDKMEDRIGALAVIERRIVALDITVQGWDRRFETMECTNREAFERFDRLLREVARDLMSGKV